MIGVGRPLRSRARVAKAATVFGVAAAIASAALASRDDAARIVAPSRALAQPAPSPDASVVVARVGGQSITAADLDRRLRGVPPYVLKDYGANPREIRRNFLERVLVRELVLTLGAIDAGFEKRPELADRTRSILRSAIIEQVKQQQTAAPISDEDVRKYYEANKDKYVAPKRISVWRILVATEAEAREILADMKQSASLDVKKWNQLARDKSLDKITSMKSGNIGFLNPDGTTPQPELVYDVAIYNEAEKVQDGELVAEPVKEGAQWAVVWRKQAMKAVSRTIEMEGATIRAAILDERIRKVVTDLLGELRAAHLSDSHPDLVDALAVSETGEVERVSRPGMLPRKTRAAETKAIDTPIGPR